MLLFDFIFAEVSSSSYPATERLWSDRPRQRQARPFTATTRRPVASATRPSSQMAVGTRARTARPSSALAVGGVCPCDPTRWGKATLSQHKNTYFYPCEVAHSNIANIKPALTKVWCSILHTFQCEGQKEWRTKENTLIVIKGWIETHSPKQHYASVPGQSCSCLEEIQHCHIWRVWILKSITSIISSDVHAL